MAQIIKTTGEVIEVAPKNGTDFSLEEMQEIVNHNGNHYIEVIYLPNNKLMIINEEGKCEHVNAPINHKATDIFIEAFGAYDFVCGNVLVCDADQVK